MHRVVVDASALLRALQNTQGHAQHATGPLSGLLLHAPHHLDAEITNAIRKLVLRGEIPVVQAEVLLHRHRRTAIERFALRPLIEHAWALKENITLYDAMYVALAMVLAVPLITTDARLARAASAFCEVTTLSRE